MDSCFSYSYKLKTQSRHFIHHLDHLHVSYPSDNMSPHTDPATNDWSLSSTYPCSIEGPLNVSPSTLSSQIDPEQSTGNPDSHSETFSKTEEVLSRFQRLEEVLSVAGGLKLNPKNCSLFMKYHRSRCLSVDGSLKKLK